MVLTLAGGLTTPLACSNRCTGKSRSSVIEDVPVLTLEPERGAPLVSASCRMLDGWVLVRLSPAQSGHVRLLAMGENLDTGEYVGLYARLSLPSGYLSLYVPRWLQMPAAMARGHVTSHVRTANRDRTHRLVNSERRFLCCRAAAVRGNFHVIIHQPRRLGVL